ncbi:TRAP-type C4-dicarboxylate transport system, substrate-binding protein [Lutimaribacter pacificus]|uniref:TRAP-type C4-dicarboxylate transport system, substrate-binding protein n=1 Tax=Lutimaribacter pacificus TaxID=391948 RepID=A0A1H0M2H1_9RHOB|nr:TRAP transporter substrate-binding protein DctP [Lutimaribacter pacificus]SDO74639.1 TRAP-type C4-dicarboxylate transport system, substrate-binding protein [Lutimaribacter pacificus]SHK77034.1 TRAP-type C4-dicarboxylate transport system, substrate-binding protein [Lutimaribacter pacificus]
MNKILRQSVCALALTVASGIGAQAENLRLLTSWDMTMPANVHIVQNYVERVQERSEGEIEITIDGPEVVAAFEQIEPVQAGVFQLLFTHPAYHTSVTWAGFSLDSSVDPGPEKRREIGLWDAMDEAYNKIGLKLIALPGSGNQGYQFVVSKKPEDGDMPFAGLKLRGSPSYKPIIEALGGALVVLPGGETYAAMDRGVVDGAGWPLIGFESTKLAEVSEYYVRPTFGSSTYVLLMNLNAWSALDEDTQKTLLEIGAEIERDGYKAFEKLKTQEVERMQAAGMEEYAISDAAAERMQEAFVKEQRSTALEAGGDETRKVIEIFEANGL